MPLERGTIPSLTGGVSQQPAVTRLPSQCQLQVNAHDTVLDGLRKRPPSEHLALISSSPLGTAHIHTINRDINERYIVVLTDGDLRVFGLDGSEKTVAFPFGKDYLNVNNALKDFSAVTVADYTFIVNRTVKVDMEPVGADQNPQNEDFWWLSRSLTGDELDEAIANASQTARKAQYAPNPSGGTFRGAVQSFEELPETPSNGDIYEVRGTTESAFTTYYVRRVGALWEETVKPGIKNLIDATTMPHALVRLEDGTFEFGPFSFAPRRVGSESTNPNPSFVGRKIRDVFFWKNRLGVCVDENVVLSAAGDFGNFYRLTVLDLLADSVIDIAASETKVTKLEYAVPFPSALMLFSDQVQFELTAGEGGASPTSVSLDPVTNYAMSLGVRPVSVGSDVYFISEGGDHATVREYFVSEDTVTNEAANVTGHVPKYIPRGVIKLAGSSDHDILFVLTDEGNKLYRYKWYWVGEGDRAEKAQSSWCVWEFHEGDKILSIDMIENHLYLVVERGTNVFLERISLEPSAHPEGSSRECYLDRRFNVTGTYSPATGRTTFNLPYAPDQDAFRLVHSDDFTSSKGALIDPSGYEWTDSNTVTVLGDHSAGVCHGGISYTMRYEFSEQFLRDSEGVAINTGRLTMRTFRVYYTDTAYFKTEVKPYGDLAAVDPEIETIIPSQLTEFTGKTVGDGALLGEQNYATGSYAFSVWGEAPVARVALINDSHVASTFVSVEWEANYVDRTQEKQNAKQ